MWYHAWARVSHCIACCADLVPLVPEQDESPPPTQEASSLAGEVQSPPLLHIPSFVVRVRVARVKVRCGIRECAYRCSRTRWLTDYACLCLEERHSVQWVIKAGQDLRVVRCEQPTHSTTRVKGMHAPAPPRRCCSCTGGRRRLMALPPPLDSGGEGKQRVRQK